MKKLVPIPYFDWYKFIPLNIEKHTGNNILHPISKNTLYKHDKGAVEFVSKYLYNAKCLESDAEAIRFASDSVIIDGAFLEMGTRIGKTLSFIGMLNPKKQVYGFDSFNGFSEDWNSGFQYMPSGIVAKDALALDDNYGFKEGKFIPPMPKNVVIFKGYFCEVLPQFKQQILKGDPIAFLHIDCDTYSSTRDVFSALKENIVSGTVILFDELYNYPNFREHEWKALQELQVEKNIDIDFIGFNIYHRQVIVLIK